MSTIILEGTVFVFEWPSTQATPITELLHSIDLLYSMHSRNSFAVCSLYPQCREPIFPCELKWTWTWACVRMGSVGARAGAHASIAGSVFVCVDVHWCMWWCMCQAEACITLNVFFAGLSRSMIYFWFERSCPKCQNHRWLANFKWCAIPKQAVWTSRYLV